MMVLIFSEVYEVQSLYSNCCITKFYIFLYQRIPNTEMNELLPPFICYLFILYTIYILREKIFKNYLKSTLINIIIIRRMSPGSPRDWLPKPLEALSQRKLFPRALNWPRDSRNWPVSPKPSIK